MPLIESKENKIASTSIGSRAVAEPYSFFQSSAGNLSLDEIYLQEQMKTGKPFSYLGVVWQPASKPLPKVNKDQSNTDKKTFK